ncbi:MAG: CRISPR-associated endonuclease Cas1 [Saprospiraceae bacterium]
MAHHIILDTNGMTLKKKSGSFHLISKKEQKYISPKKVATITISADCMLSSAAVSLAVEHAIPIYYINRSGKVYAKLYSKKYSSHERLRIKQTLFQWTKPALVWIIKSLILKSECQVNYIVDHNDTTYKSPLIKAQTKYAESLHVLLHNYDGYLDIQKIINLESGFGLKYWKEYRNNLSYGWIMKARNIRPAQDAINCCINYFYGFYYSLVEHAVYLAGLNPYQGLLHQNQYNNPVLTFDLIEPFRPYVDDFVLNLFNSKIIDLIFFDEKNTVMYLNRKGKKVLLPMFFDYLENVVEFNNHSTTRKNQVYRYVDQLKKEINKLNLDDIIDKL